MAGTRSVRTVGEPTRGASDPFGNVIIYWLVSLISTGGSATENVRTCRVELTTSVYLRTDRGHLDQDCGSLGPCPRTSRLSMLLALMRLRLNRWDDAYKWATLIRGHLGQNAGAAAGPRRMADPITSNPITDERYSTLMA